MILNDVDITLIEAHRGEMTLKNCSSFLILFVETGAVELFQASQSEPTRLLGTSANRVSEDDVNAAFLYKCAAVMRVASIDEPVDITPDGIERAHKYFSDGQFRRRAKFLGLIS